jgi:hypothetical protein
MITYCDHRWTDYGDGWAICHGCGSARDPRGWISPPGLYTDLVTHAVEDGVKRIEGDVTVVGPPS